MCWKTALTQVVVGLQAEELEKTNEQLRLRVQELRAATDQAASDDNPGMCVELWEHEASIARLQQMYDEYQQQNKELSAFLQSIDPETFDVAAVDVGETATS